MLISRQEGLHYFEFSSYSFLILYMRYIFTAKEPVIVKTFNRLKEKKKKNSMGGVNITSE